MPLPIETVSFATTGEFNINPNESPYQGFDESAEDFARRTARMEAERQAAQTAGEASTTQVDAVTPGTGEDETTLPGVDPAEIGLATDVMQDMSEAPTQIAGTIPETTSATATAEASPKESLGDETSASTDEGSQEDDAKTVPLKWGPRHRRGQPTIVTPSGRLRPTASVEKKRYPRSIIAAAVLGTVIVAISLKGGALRSPEATSQTPVEIATAVGALATETTTPAPIQEPLSPTAMPEAADTSTANNGTEFVLVPQDEGDQNTDEVVAPEAPVATPEAAPAPSATPETETMPLPTNAARSTNPSPTATTAAPSQSPAPSASATTPEATPTSPTPSVEITFEDGEPIFSPEVTKGLTKDQIRDLIEGLEKILVELDTQPTS